MEYAIVEQAGSDRLLVVGCDRLEPLRELLGELKVLTTFGGEFGLSSARNIGLMERIDRR